MRTFVVIVLAACAPMPRRAEPPRAENAVAATVSLRVDFEPPLAEPGLLFVEHECGLRLRVATGRSGVDLELPPGPASLRLTADGREWAVPVVVGAVREIVVLRSR